MSLDHDAIYKAYPNAVRIDDGKGAFDASGNSITLVHSNIDAARNTLNTEAAAEKYKKDSFDLEDAKALGIERSTLEYHLYQASAYFEKEKRPYTDIKEAIDRYIYLADEKTKFYDRFENEMAGVACTFDVYVSNDIDLCS